MEGELVDEEDVSLCLLSLFVVSIISKACICFLFGQPSNGKELDLEFSLDDLETIKVIGKGSGGVVQLVRHKWLGKLFALKVFIKALETLTVACYISCSSKI